MKRFREEESDSDGVIGETGIQEFQEADPMEVIDKEDKDVAPMNWYLSFNLVPVAKLMENPGILPYLVLSFQNSSSKSVLKGSLETKNAILLVRYLEEEYKNYSCSECPDESCKWIGDPASANFVQVLRFRVVQEDEWVTFSDYNDFIAYAIALSDFNAIQDYAMYFTNSLDRLRALTTVSSRSRLHTVREKKTTWQYAINFMSTSELNESLHEGNGRHVWEYVILEIENARDESVLTDDEKKHATELVQIIKDKAWDTFAKVSEKDTCKWIEEESGNVLKVVGFRLKPCEKSYTTLAKLKQTKKLEDGVFDMFRQYLQYFTSLKQQQNLAETPRKGIHTYSKVVKTEYQRILRMKISSMYSFYDEHLINRKFMFPLTLSDFAGRSAFLLLAYLIKTKPGTMEFLVKACKDVLELPGGVFNGDDGDAVFERKKRVFNAYGPQMSCVALDIARIASAGVSAEGDLRLIDQLLMIVDGRTFWTLLKLVRPFFSDSQDELKHIDKLIYEYGNKVFSDLINIRTEIRRTEEYLIRIRSKEGIEQLMQEYLDCTDTSALTDKMNDILISNVYMRVPYYDKLLSLVTMKACQHILSVTETTPVDDLRIALASVPLPALQCFAKLKQGRECLNEIGKVAAFVQNVFVLDSLRCCKVYHLESFQKAVRIMIGEAEEENGIHCVLANKPLLLALSSVIPAEFQTFGGMFHNFKPSLAGLVHTDFDNQWEEDPVKRAANDDYDF